MTEKRFTHKKWYDERQVFDGEEPFAIVDVYNQAETICDKLNELAEENEQLKCEVYSYKCSTETDKEIIGDLHKEYKVLEKENKELKGLIDLFAQDICDLTELLCKNNIDYKLHSDVTNFIVKWGIRID